MSDEWVRELSGLDSVIFDLDGTLWNANRSVAEARNSILEEMGIAFRKFTPEDVAATAGMQVDQVYRLAFPGFSEELIASIRPLITKRIQETIASKGADLYPGVLEGVPRLAKRFRLFIVSNCSEGYIESFLQFSSLGSHFEGHLCYGATGNGKAENIASVMKEFELVAPLYVGDTGGDHSSAFQAGARYIHMNYGFGEPIAPCLRLDSFDQLVETVLRL